MDPQALRLHIRQKLADGRLPWDGTPREWGGPGNGEVCDGCDQPTLKDEFLMEGVTSTSDANKGIQLHVKCFYVWEVERRAGPSNAPAGAR